MSARGDDPFVTRVKRVSAVLIVAFLVFVVVQQGRESGSSTSGQPAAPTVAQKPVPAQQVQAQPQPTAPPAPIATSAAVGARQNPVPFGREHTYAKDGRTFRIRVLEVARNARGQFPEAGPINPRPPDGQDYIVAKISVAYVDGPQDKPWKPSDGNQRYYAANQLWGAPGIMTNAPRPSLPVNTQEVFPGATLEGWLQGKHVPVDQMDGAMLVYDDVYFALR